MKLSAADRDELHDDLDELIDAVRELKHELGNDNEEIKPSGGRHHKKSRNNGGGYNKKNKANNRRNY
ncbi:hypothetical protein CMI37_09890 [Candidatus Pacearchaeota archaeon]|nr:hypothetical protein [Candidatus Pacearchaeota archaeon]|tara:strand:- start:3014 stop:3214 length:201 start_codon:yes stop_codon:yes gene_type:complete